MRRLMTLIGCSVLLFGWTAVVAAQEQAPTQKPTQAPEQKQVQAPVQKAVQAPVQKQVQAPVQKPVQAPVQKMTPVQKPVQKPTQKSCCQSPVQKGGKMAERGLFRRRV